MIFIFLLFDLFDYVVLAVYIFFLVFAIIFTVMFGEGNLDKVVMTGPF